MSKGTTNEGIGSSILTYILRGGDQGLEDIYILKSPNTTNLCSFNKSRQIDSPVGQIWSNRLSGWSNIKYFRGHAKICGETTSDLCKFPSLSDQPEVPLNFRGATPADHLHSKGRGWTSRVIYISLGPNHPPVSGLGASQVVRAGQVVAAFVISGHLTDFWLPR